SATLNSCSDTQLVNGTVYGYLVVAVFQGVDGKAVYSEGVKVTAVPTELPQAVTDLMVVRRGSEFETTWIPPAVGQVQIVVSESAPPCTCGDLMAASDLSKLGPSLTNLSLHSGRGTIR